jgi:hypothetical protein
MSSSGKYRRMALVRTDVSGEPSPSITRVTIIGELGTTLVVTSRRRTLRRNTKYLVITKATRSNIPEDGILHVYSFIFRRNGEGYRTWKRVKRKGRGLRRQESFDAYRIATVKQDWRNQKL